VKLEGDLLDNVLKAHRSALHIVSFNEVTLDSLSEWQHVLETLRLGRVRRLELAWLRYSDPDAGVLKLWGPTSFSKALTKKDGGTAVLWMDFAEVAGSGVVPALKIILQGLKSLV